MSEFPHLELFGGVNWCWRGGRFPLPPGRPTLLAVGLADAAPNSISPERLIDLLWPDSAPASGRNALQRHVSRLRAWFRRDLDLDLDGDKDGLSIVPSQLAIVEVKVDDRVPFWLTDLVARHDLQLVRVSKYCQSIERFGRAPRSQTLDPVFAQANAGGTAAAEEA